ncbi:MAG: Chemotaxis protein methyltransferase [bacterium]|nr:Chemotaxis protein methyltransferase [bacterium]
MDRETFNEIRDFVYARSGIHLAEHKESMVGARVGKRMRALGFDNPRAYMNYVLEDRGGEEAVRLLDAISTNVTSFLREPRAFEFLRSRIEEWWREGRRKFRFWSAACSTGEEPYSIALTALESSAGNGADLRILATDISTQVLQTAARGIYSEEQVAPLAGDLLIRHFARTLGEGGRPEYQVRAALRDRISFCRLNLSDPPFPMSGPFDVVFCRNVMIYFDLAVRNRLLAETHRLLRPGGFLILGQSEGLAGVTTQLKTVAPSVYRKEE